MTAINREIFVHDAIGGDQGRVRSAGIFLVVHSLRPSRDDEEHATSRVVKFPPVVAEHRTLPIPRRYLGNERSVGDLHAPSVGRCSYNQLPPTIKSPRVLMNLCFNAMTRYLAMVLKSTCSDG